MISLGDKGVGVLLNAFADLAATKRKPIGKTPKYKTNPVLLSRTEKEKRYIARRILDHVTRGMRFDDASKRVGVSPAWIVSFCGRLPETDPLRKRYKRLSPRLQMSIQALQNVERVVALMEQKNINGKEACRQLEYSHDKFYSWVKKHRDTKLYKRYVVARDAAPNWRSIR